MEFTGTFTIGRKEVSRFTRRIEWVKRERVILVFSAIGLLAGNFALRLFVETPTLLQQIACSLLGGLFVFGLCYGMLIYSIAKMCNSDFTAGRRWTQSQTLTINALGVTCKIEEGKSSHADFNELTVEECSEAFYIFIAKDAAWILPKAQLAEPETDAKLIRDLFSTMAEPDHLNLQRAK